MENEEKNGTSDARKSLMAVALNEVIIEFLGENRAEIMARAKAKLVAKGFKVEETELTPMVASTVG